MKTLKTKIYKTEAYGFFSKSDLEDAKAFLDSEVMSAVIFKHALHERECVYLRSDVERIISQYETEENLRNHSAYIPDKTPGRESHGFQITCGESFWLLSYPMMEYIWGKRLPTIEIEERYTEINRLYYNHLYISKVFGYDIPARPRIFLGTQISKWDGPQVYKHMDGEYLEFEQYDDGSFKALETLAAQFVVIYITKKTLGSYGTRFIDPQTKEEYMIQGAEEGDAVIFYNTNKLHAVPPQPSGEGNDVIRQTVSTRSWDISPVFVKGRIPEVISPEKAKDLLLKWYEEKWPSIYDNQNKAVF